MRRSDVGSDYYGSPRKDNLSTSGFCSGLISNTENILSNSVRCFDFEKRNWDIKSRQVWDVRSFWAINLERGKFDEDAKQLRLYHGK